MVSQNRGSERRPPVDLRNVLCCGLNGRAGAGAAHSQEPALGRFSVFEARKPCAVASFSHMYAPALVVP
jgi:hypothetical protein